MNLDNYNFTDDFQDTILACLIRYPDKFFAFGQVIKPGYFNGPEQVQTVFHLLDYHKEHGKYPNFTVLGNYAFYKVSRTNVTEANEIVNYVAKLSEIDTADWKGVLRQCVDFAKERAIYDAVRKIHAAQSQGKMDKIDPREVIENALRVANYGLPPAKDMATALQVGPARRACGRAGPPVQQNDAGRLFQSLQELSAAGAGRRRGHRLKMAGPQVRPAQGTFCRSRTA